MALSWYAEELPALFDTLETSHTGLSAEEVVRRRREDGSNTLPETEADGYGVIFLRQFQSPLIFVLFAASIAVFVLGEVADGVIILFVLLFNSIIGTVQEGRAQNTLRALKKYVETRATVLRDGAELSIRDDEVVRGDILILHEGDKVSADARLLSVNGLKLDESSLTGESAPIGKAIDTLHRKELPVSEQKNMVFKGTTVSVGNGMAVVVLTDARTVIGTIAKEIALIDTEIPLKANIRYLSRVIIGVVGGMSVILFILGLIEGQAPITIFATVVSLAVSVIPEGLPVVITLVLATGVWRMSKRNALVKKLQAVEALGQARIVAVDKTGTITENELVVREAWTEGKTFTIDGLGYEPKGTVRLDDVVVDAANHPELLLLGKMAALSASARTLYSEKEKRWQVFGDPTEAAIRVFGEKIGFKKDDVLHESPLLSEIAFDYRLKYHAATYRVLKSDLLIVSGAPESVLALCSHVRRNGRSYALNAVDREQFEQVFSKMSTRGLRVVAVAIQEKFSGQLTPEMVGKLTFTGFFGMQDILRPEVAPAMAQAAAAGIKVVMITGDHTLTARAIAKEAGIWHEGDELLTGADINEMTDLELKVRVANVSVFARVTPEHKLRIISAYKNRGEIVAMTGDGVNDAPSLVAADLGVAMGKSGTEVAKEAADIVLLDDNFGSIISAVEEGRNIYKTIKKVILYLFSTSLGEALTILFALFLGYPLPLLAAQIIWLNFVTDGFLDVALAMEPKENGLLSQILTRPKRYIVDGLMAQRMVLMAVPMMLGTLFLFQRYMVSDIERAWTISLTVLAVFQWFNAWNCRSESKSFFRKDFFSNPYLLLATVVVASLQILAVYTPFLQRVLHTVPLSFFEWVIIIAVASSILWVEEIRKIYYRKRLHMVAL